MANTEKCIFYQALMAYGLDQRGVRLVNYMKSSATDDLQDVKKLFRPTLKTTSEFGNTFDDVILSCNFGSKECNRKNFSTLFSESHGKCFVFNYVGSDDDRKPLQIQLAGRQNGLQLYMQIRDSDSIDLLNSQIGMRIIIHDPHLPPFASEHGIDIRPGDMSSIVVEHINISRLGKPWGKCVKDGSNLPFKYEEKVYSQIACERMCMSDLVYRECHCHYRKFLISAIIPHRKSKMCNITHSMKDDACVSRILQRKDEDNMLCRCPLPCNENAYATSLSAGEVNEDFFKLVRSAKSIKIKDGIPYVPDFSHKNKFQIMGVRVYYREMFYTSIKETEAYSWQSLIANIGGNIGLFLGLSLVTFLEIFEFLMDTLWSALIAKKRMRKKNLKKHLHKIHPRQVIVWNSKRRIHFK